ncbi:ubiquitin domain-containing protein [Tieghemostelium lacteum]|uniref:Ubiquitin domain-containing protein n=1 Tax=Tieghemostelium lacteum TaxID=361077 RepID=A0A152A4D1_TIELA|nr:ubiquitin domain-containing protein [Tieghemostelium lacteum]|eukprot:KYR00921.1 ubiquitin domain-containing protein [Tieghemostelium lacteum]
MDGIVFDVLFNGQPLPIQLSLDSTLNDLKEMLENFTGIPRNEQVLINLPDNVKSDTILAQVDLIGLELLHIPEQPPVNNNVQQQQEQQQQQQQQPIQQEPYIPPQVVGQHPPLNFHEDDLTDDDDIEDFENLHVQQPQQQQQVYQTSRFATNFFPDVQTDNGQISTSSLIEFIDQLHYPAFTEEMMNTYSAVVPQSFAKSFKEAMAEGRRQGKLVMAYLHSFNNDMSMTFCLDILRSEEIFQLISENFIFWVANITPEAEALFFSLIQFESYPIVALVANYGSPQLISMMQGVSNKSEFYNKLITEIESNQPELERIRDEEEESHQHRMIVEEQDLAYQESLKADKEKKEKLEKEQREAENKAQEKLDHGKLVPPEPPKSKDSTQIVFKLPGDVRVDRRFNSTDTLLTLRNYLDGEGCEIENYQFVTQYPKKVFKKEDFNLTMIEAGLHPQSILNVRDEDN